jgi:hypothetical protein
VWRSEVVYTVDGCGEEAMPLSKAVDGRIKGPPAHRPISSVPPPL